MARCASMAVVAMGSGWHGVGDVDGASSLGERAIASMLAAYVAVAEAGMGSNEQRMMKL